MRQPGDTLIVHQGALGDLVLTLSALDRLLNGSRIDIFCQVRFISLVYHLNVVGRAFNVESREFANLYAEKPDQRHAVLFHGYRQIIIFSDASVLRKNIAFLANCPVYVIPPRPDSDTQIHVIDYLIERLAGVLSGVPTDCLDHRRVLQRSNTRFRGKIMIHPGSGSLRKNWPLENFIRLHRKLKRNGIDAAWIIGPAESFLSEKLLRRKIPKQVIFENQDLVDFCRRSTDYTGFVGNDSGLTHLAAWLGIPVVAVFGPSDPARWCPVGPDVTVISPGNDCLPCFERQPNNCGDSACLKSISADKVFREIMS